ncbi:MAG: hypothetical protein PVSMB4_00650 [Ktedonobacterales bacterium]
MVPVRVLAVDDEADILHLIEIKLKKAGFEVMTGRDGQEGLDKALAEKPDLMLVDVMMPQLDGYAVVREVKRQLGVDAPIIILLTAKGQEADVVKGLSSGADDYIIKPFSPRELIARVNVLLIKHGKHAGASSGE